MGIRLTNQKKEPLTQAAISEDDLSLTSSYSGYSGELSGLNSSCGNSDDSPCKSPMAFSTTALYSNTNSSVGTDLVERDNLAAYDIGSDLDSDSEDFKFQEAVSCQDNTAVYKILKDFRERIDVNKITRSGMCIAWYCNVLMLLLRMSLITQTSAIGINQPSSLLFTTRIL